MVEISSSEIFLNREERISLMKENLQRVIDEVVDVEATNSRRNIKLALEDFFVHAEAAGYELEFSKQQKYILDILKKRKNAPYEQIAYWCAQLLGMLEVQPDFADESVIKKNEFLKRLQSLLTEASKNGDTASLLEITKLISGFNCDNDDEDVKKIISGIEEILIDIFVYGIEVSTVQLTVHREIIIAMRNNLPIGLS